MDESNQETLPSWIITEADAHYLSNKGWIVASSLINRGGVMRWPHGGPPPCEQYLREKWQGK